MAAEKKAGAVRKRATPKAPSRNSTAESMQHHHEVGTRLRRVEGQIRGVLAMMERGEPCDTIAQQLSAARKALDRAFFEMMACSLEMEAMGSSDRNQMCERIAEKARLMAKYA